jgi:hypothetical protein
MEHWVIYRKDGSRTVYAGTIEGHPGFKGWRGGNHKQAFVVVDEWLCDANKRNDIKSETGLCAENCKKADPGSACHCICAGQNHGIEFDGISEIELTEDDEVWLGVVEEA